MKTVENCSMAEYTSFKCGGKASVFIVAENIEELSSVVKNLSCSGKEYLILGNGSNILFSDEGYPGTVIKLGDSFGQISVEGSEITAGAAAILAAVSKSAANSSLTGMEFASGIPGSVGGAVFMNAGAYGGEMKNVLVSVTSMDNQGNIITRSADQLDLSYRHSCFMGLNEVILSAVIKLQPGDKNQIENLMKELKEKRVSKQPVQYPSAGSFFKRPEGYFAGKLIEDSGLKGLTIGGAQVSQLHAGFVINRGGATASDVINLMRVVQETVLNDSGVMLEPEVRIIGHY